MMMNIGGGYDPDDDNGADIGGNDDYFGDDYGFDGDASDLMGGLDGFNYDLPIIQGGDDMGMDLPAPSLTPRQSSSGSASVRSNAMDGMDDMPPPTPHRDDMPPPTPHRSFSGGDGGGGGGGGGGMGGMDSPFTGGISTMGSHLMTPSGPNGPGGLSGGIGTSTNIYIIFSVAKYVH